MHTEEEHSYLVVWHPLDHNPFPYSGDKNYQKRIQKVVEKY